MNSVSIIAIIIIINITTMLQEFKFNLCRDKPYKKIYSQYS